MITQKSLSVVGTKRFLLYRNRDWSLNSILELCITTTITIGIVLSWGSIGVLRSYRNTRFFEMLRQEINISNSSAILQQQKPSCIENHVHGNRRVSICFMHSNDLICTSWKKHVEDYFIAFSIVLKLWKSPSTCFNTATRQSSFNTLNQLLMSHNWTWVKFLLLLSPHYTTTWLRTFPILFALPNHSLGFTKRQVFSS